MCLTQLARLKGADNQEEGQVGISRRILLHQPIAVNHLGGWGIYYVK